MDRQSSNQDVELPQPDGREIFDDSIVQRWPLLSSDAEAQWDDAQLREDFLTRFYAMHRLTALFQGDWSRGAVVGFHSREKFLLLAHDEATYRQLGPLVAKVKHFPRDEFAKRYQRWFAHGLMRPATVGRHCNVLEHLIGFFRNELTPEERTALRKQIQNYRRGSTPRSVPTQHILRHAQQQRIEYLCDQTYLQPYGDR